MQNRRLLRSFAVAAVAASLAIVFAGFGCGTVTTLENGVAPCTTDPDCPPDYHCALDLTCYRNGADPAHDASFDACSGAVCSGACVDTRSDRANCGACGKTCMAGEVCSQGTCALSCAASTANCNGACRDTTSDPNDCGACGNACAAGLVCSAGTCALECAGGATNCTGACVNTKTDVANCGACGKACASGYACKNGVCETTCGGNDSLCMTSSGKDAGDASTAYCSNLSADRSNCGACALTCAPGLVCSGGTCQVSCQANLVECAGVCIDPLTSRAYCGATAGCGEGGNGSAGAVCPSGQVCAAGTCQTSCPNGQINCGGTCIDPSTSLTHCGATNGCGAPGGSAGAVCPNGNVCSNGTCTVSCPGSQIVCGGTCVDPQTSLAYCGATPGCGVAGAGSAGTACAAGTVCGNGICSVSCPGTQVNCGGTCIDPFTSRTNCGATGACGAGGGTAGTACVAGNVCANGVCAVSCPGQQINCGGTCIDPQTSRSNCGASGACGAGGGSAGAACKNGNVCSNGSCQVSCPGSQINCGGTCIDPQTSRSNCGATDGCGLAGGSAGQPCTNGNVCANGSCQVSCPGSQINCGGVCIDPQTSPSHCGATDGCGAGGGSGGTACSAGKVCTSGTCQASCSAPLIACSGTCVDPRFDPGHCGSCNACPAVANATSYCLSGSCGIASCASGFADCNKVVADGCEINTKTSNANCGSCGNACGAGMACSNGTCVPATTVCSTAPENGTVSLTCPGGAVMRSIEFASYGTPNGSCGMFTTGACHAGNSTAIVSAQCLNNPSCAVGANNGTFGDPCGGTVKRLYVQVTCSP